MASRGVYSPEEEQIIADWKKAQEGASFWLGEEPTNVDPYPVFHREATKDLIRTMASGLSDRNPLFRDDNYARNTRWGGIIAPPLFPFVLCHRGRVGTLNVPETAGSCTEFTSGYRAAFFKPIHAGDTFKVRDSVAPSLQDKTRLDGTGPRTFQIESARRYINQNDEAVADIFSKRTTVITPPGGKKEQPVLQMLPMPEYRYTKEEIAFVDRIYDEEIIRGADTLYWEDVNIGDELQPTATGPITIWDQLLDFSGVFVPNMREIRKKTPSAIIVDPVTNVPHKTIELHLVDRIAQLMGATTAIVGTCMINESLCRVITNWMGDDGFLKAYDSSHRAITPQGDSIFCRGKVINKRIENGEHLVDLAVWVESIRGYIAMSAKATVSLFSKQDD